jgi:hypothetical protein
VEELADQHMALAHLLPLLEEAPQARVALLHPLIFKVEMAEGVRRSTPGLQFLVKMEMRMQSLELHTNSVLVVAVVDGERLEQLEETSLAGRVEQSVVLVPLEATLVPVAVAVTRDLLLVEVALSES